MKQVFRGCALVVAIWFALWSAWRHWDRTTQQLVAGSEQTYIGVVSDRAMSEFQNWHRGYISIELQDGSWLLFWAERGRDSVGEAFVGDTVKIESAVEKDTEVLVVLDMAILEKGEG